jgi:hypothetical protein
MANRTRTKDAEPPLKTKLWQERDKNGILVDRALLRRGLLLHKITASIPDGYILDPVYSPQQQLHGIIFRLRKELKQAGLPTDEQYIWIREAGAQEWRADDDIEIEVAGPYELKTWREVLYLRTEIMSVHRQRADYLDALTKLVDLGLDEHRLDVVARALKAARNVAIAELANPLFIEIDTARKGLAEGRKARKAATPTKMEIVCRHAERLWRRKAALRGDQINTAAEIAEHVNADFKAHGFPPVRPKRIAEYIGEAIRGELLKIGQCGADVGQ